MSYLAALGDVHGADDVVDEDGEEEAGKDLDQHTMEPKVSPLQQAIISLSPFAEVHVVQRCIVASGVREGRREGRTFNHTYLTILMNQYK